MLDTTRVGNCRTWQDGSWKRTMLSLLDEIAQERRTEAAC